MQALATLSGVTSPILVVPYLATRRHADVHATLAQVPRLKVVWLPSDAPWLNPIEQLEKR